MTVAVAWQTVDVASPDSSCGPELLMLLFLIAVVVGVVSVVDVLEW